MRRRTPSASDSPRPLGRGPQFRDTAADAEKHRFFLKEKRCAREVGPCLQQLRACSPGPGGAGAVGVRARGGAQVMSGWGWVATGFWATWELPLGLVRSTHCQH